MYDVNPVRKLAVNILDSAYCSTERVSLVIMVEGIKKRTVFPYKGGFCSGRTRINPKKSLSLIGG